jgi:hypothetical protein
MEVLMPSQDYEVSVGPGSLLAVDCGRPTLRTVIDGVEAQIELQTSAVLAMTGARSKPLDAASSRSDLAIAAAKRLYRSGFYDRTARGVQIVVTALDL